MVISSFADLCVLDVGASVGFYRALLGLEVLVDHGWYAEMGVDGRTLIAFVEAGHETVPASSGGPPSGVLLSFVVDDVDQIAGRATELAHPIVWPLTTELGQRHLMTADPDGAVVDVIQHVALTAVDRRRLVQLRREHEHQPLNG